VWSTKEILPKVKIEQEGEGSCGRVRRRVRRAQKVGCYACCRRECQWHVRCVLCRERICISSFADASQALIPMDGIFHVQMKNKQPASSKHPMDGIVSSLAALSPYGRENENHIERFHGSTSIVPQEALQLTTPSSRFSSAYHPSTRSAARVRMVAFKLRQVVSRSRKISNLSMAWKQSPHR